MNATDEDEFGEFLGLPSDLDTASLSQIPSRQLNNRKLAQSDDLYNALYGGGKGQAKIATKDIQYDDLFGEARPTEGTLVPVQSVTSQSGNELGQEPLFPDVDETKIQPTLSLSSNVAEPQHNTTLASEGEFSIVVDQTGSDTKFLQQNNGPMAGWVITTSHGRRETSQIKAAQPASYPSNTVSVRPAPGGGHHAAGASVGPLHPRSIPGTGAGGNNGGSRAIRIPQGCNPDLEPEFPSRAAADQSLKLPGQTRVTPDEYKEFLGLGHGEIFDLDLDRVVDPPWRAPGSDPSDFFNYDMDEDGWKDYCRRIESHRQEFSMKKKIQTYESTSLNFQQDPDLPPEVAAAIAAETCQTRSGTTPDMPKALPIPVFQGLDDYSLRNRRGRDFRRPEVRYDPDVIKELVPGVVTSNAVNADYGEDYIGIFGRVEIRESSKKLLEEDDEAYTLDQPNQELPSKEEKEEMILSNASEEESLVVDAKKQAKEDAVAMFGDDEFVNHFDPIQPGELAMGMDADSHNITSWTAQKTPIPPPGRANSAGGPPRPEFGRNYDFYMPHQEMWHPFHQRPMGGGRGGWRPRGGSGGGGMHPNYPEFWNQGRGGGGNYGRHYNEGRRGGGNRSYGGSGGGGSHHPYVHGRRPGRQIPPPHYDDYLPHPQALWPPKEDHPSPLDVESDYGKPHSLEESKGGGGSTRSEKGSMGYSREYDDERLNHGGRANEVFRQGDRDRRRYGDEEWDEEKQQRPYHLSSKSRGRDHEVEYGRDKKVPSHHHRAGGDGRGSGGISDYGRNRKEDHEDRHRGKRRRGKSSERRNRHLSHEKSRGREKEEKRNRRHESSSESGSDPTLHYRNWNERD